MTLRTIQFKLQPIKVEDGKPVADDSKPELELTANMISLSDVEHFTLWVRKLLLEKYTATLQALGVQGPDRIALIHKRIKELATVSWARGEGLAEICTVDGMVEIVTRLVTPAGSLSAKDLKQMLLLPANWKRILDVVYTSQNIDAIGVPHPTQAP